MIGLQINGHAAQPLILVDHLRVTVMAMMIASTTSYADLTIALIHFHLLLTAAMILCLVRGHLYFTQGHRMGGPENGNFSLLYIVNMSLHRCVGGSKIHQNTLM